MHPRSLREAYQWWQQICHGVAPRRRARGWEQQSLAEEADIALNTVQRIERGEWVAAHNLFQVCSVLDLDRGGGDRGRRRTPSSPCAKWHAWENRCVAGSIALCSAARSACGPVRPRWGGCDERAVHLQFVHGSVSLVAYARADELAAPGGARGALEDEADDGSTPEA